MTTTAECFSLVIQSEQVAEQLTVVREKLGSAGPEVLLDFFFVQTLEPSGIRALEELDAAAEVLKTRIVLRGINVELYKVLKLAQLTDKFLFIN